LRQIGTLPLNLDPNVLTDHLLTMGVTTRVDQRPEGWAVWAHHEDQIPQAKQELEEFLKNPNDPRYHHAVRSAQTIRREAELRDRQFRKNVRDMSGYWDRPNLRRRPLTTALIAISVVVFLLENSRYRWVIINALTFSRHVIDEFGRPRSLGLSSILHGEVWRLITPIFLHFGILHLLFNMWALWVLGSLVEYRRGTKTLAVVVLITAIASNLGQHIFDLNSGHGFSIFGGMSGVIYGVFGYVWMKGRQEPEQGMMLDPRTVQTMLFWLVLCFSGAIGPVANAAHVVGLIAGIVLGLAGI
jgi:GlpG protein